MKYIYSKDSAGWIIALILGLILIAVLLNVSKHSRAIKPVISDPNTLTMQFDDDSKLVVYDFEGKEVAPIQLNDNDPVGDLFRHVVDNKLLFKASGLAVFAHTKINPSCNPTIVFQSFCYAPHTWCCPGG